MKILMPVILLFLSCFFLFSCGEKKMDANEFWKLVNSSVENTPSFNEKSQSEKIYARLLSYKPEEILKYNEMLGQLVLAASNYNMLGAFYIISGSAKEPSGSFTVNDDAYLGFRVWLVFQGEDVYKKAVENADSIAAFLKPGDDPYFELIMGTAIEAYFEKAQTDTFPQLPSLGSNEAVKDVQIPLNGLSAKYPELWSRFVQLKEENN
jgi:hypothetical protein